MLISQLIYTTMWIFFQGMTKYSDKVCGNLFSKHMPLEIPFQKADKCAKIMHRRVVVEKKSIALLALSS